MPGRRSAHVYVPGEPHRPATRSSSFQLGKKGSAGNPTPSWKPNLRRDGTYDSRPQKSVRETRPETFRKLDPEIGSRVFIAGLPKDVTNQDLEDLMTGTIGPVHEVYVVHQYLGTPLYKHSTSYSGPQRNPDAENADNMRYITSTGCGMVHFQRVKDAMEAWEQYHGKLLDNDSTILRVQVVIDADETWLIPPNEKGKSADADSDMITSHVGDMDNLMAIDESVQTAPRPVVASHQGSPDISPAHTSTNGASRVTNIKPDYKLRQPVESSPNNASSSKAKQPTATKSLSKISLIHRIGPSASDPNAHLSAPIAIGGHVIAGVAPLINGSATSLAGPVAAKPLGKPANVVVVRRNLKKGPRRMAKIAVRHAANMPIPHIQAIPSQPADGNGTLTRPQLRGVSAQDLDAEMELYRKGGLMGLNGPGR